VVAGDGGEEDRRGRCRRGRGRAVGSGGCMAVRITRFLFISYSKKIACVPTCKGATTYVRIRCITKCELQSISSL
jgi:hypothetical protein